MKKKLKDKIESIESRKREPVRRNKNDTKRWPKLCTENVLNDFVNASEETSSSKNVR
jgi:hypothetical protein